MPRPRRLRLVRAPGLSRSSFSFIGGYSFALDRLDADSIDVAGLTVETPDLDDVFLSLTGDPTHEKATPR